MQPRISIVTLSYTRRRSSKQPSIRCLRVERPNVLLLCGVVQYLPKPYSFLAESIRQGFENIFIDIIDRTPFLSRGFEP